MKNFNKELLEDFIRKEWDNRWTNYPLARQTKQFYSHQSKLKAKKLLKNSRGRVSKFVNIVTGHNDLAYHTSLADPENFSDGCTYCNIDRETFFHWTTDCPAFWLSQRKIFLDKVPDADMEWNIEDLFRFSEIPAVERLLYQNLTDYE